ncbi:MAG: hypothetical protein Ct9H300mP28_24540 [Pseudomonadota bacterium]|nr:MAG: hypothetical protein Ct9H300mP28_24540 [Pseudomonadota bacterium]
MGSTDGLYRGMDVKDFGETISTPVGQGVLGRIINVTGDPVDETGPIKTKERWSIHREARHLLTRVQKHKCWLRG